MVSTPVDFQPLAWLDAQSTEIKFAWSDRGSKKFVAGVGEAACVVAKPQEDVGHVVRQCRRLLENHESIRFYGGLSFDGTDGWDKFRAGRFVVPRFLFKDGELHVIVMNHDDIVTASLELQQLGLEVLEIDDALPSAMSIEYSPAREGWRANVDQALTLIRNEVLEKVVLARQTKMTFETPLNPIYLTSRIAKATHDCFVFCFTFGEDTAFVGATPERLFRRCGTKMLSEVVAGTRRRGATSGEDQRLAYELLTSDKDQLEHDIVRKSMRQKLHKFVENLDVDTHASVLRLAKKQHLCSEVTAALRDGVDEGALLKRLHPTPAVGGYPTENALSEIARLEPFNRGWYAAPIGWIGHNDAEFVVGIRSGLIKGKELSLYSGAGIVTGSEPDQEWEEVENKIQDFVDVLGGEK